MKKYIGFFICIILSFGLAILSLTAETISCSRQTDLCIFESKIKYLNIELNRERFPVKDLTGAVCQKQMQPSKRGKQAYYLLRIETKGRTYNISSYKKLADCKNYAKSIKTYIKDENINVLNANTGSGFLNTFGMIFAFIIFITGVIILRTDSEENKDEEEGDEV